MKDTGKVVIAPAKGRPMLSWIGKRPLTALPALPAQHIETYDPTDAMQRNHSEETWSDWPAAYPRGGLLLHGDNKEVLAHLLANGFRNKVKLVFIDPPFDSGADYVRKVQLRGPKSATKFEGEPYTLGEQIQYTDIWANDNYLQFMYERLILLKEFIAHDGSIFLHCDQRKSHYLRCLLDEIFGESMFRNEIIREKQRGGKHHVQNVLGSIHDTLFHYTLSDDYVWRHLRKEVPDRILLERYPYEDEQGRYALADCRNFSGIARPNLTYDFFGFHGTWKWTKDVMETKIAAGEVVQTREGNVPRRKVRPNENGDLIQSLWYDVPDSGANKEYPTEKSEFLLARIIGLCTRPGDIVLDCFAGSGTTAAMAQKMGRRWIACDINKGAVQTTARRVQSIITRQTEETSALKQRSLEGMEEVNGASPAQLGYTVWRVNDYDLQIQHNEAVNLACEYIGVERKRTDVYFDGTLGKRLVKIIPFTHPLSPLDLDELRRELDARPDEDRDIVLVCLGLELAARSWIDDWNRHRGHGVPNRLDIIELRTDPKYAGFIRHEPAQAKVSIVRKEGGVLVRIEDFISPSILKRLGMERSLFQARIENWRSQVDCVMIDVNYDGRVFNVALSDIPARKTDLIRGEYELPLPSASATIAVKIIDMLGEEVVVEQKAHSVDDNQDGVNQCK